LPDSTFSGKIQKKTFLKKHQKQPLRAENALFWQNKAAKPGLKRAQPGRNKAQPGRNTAQPGFNRDRNQSDWI
jgi:hypothetical protein